MNYSNFIQFEIDWASSQENYFMDEKDAFAAVYDNLYLKLSFVFSYILVIICGLLLVFVIWFERSGQAGHFRTMVNQLTTFMFDQVRLRFYSANFKKILINIWYPLFLGTPKSSKCKRSTGIT